MLSQILKPEYGEEHIFIQLQCEVPRVSLCTKFKWTFLEIASLLILYPKFLMRFSLIFISIEISFTTKIITMGAWYFAFILLRGVSFPENFVIGLISDGHVGDIWRADLPFYIYRFLC